MRFVYINIRPDYLPGPRVVRGKDDNLATLNTGILEADAYFSSGDLVFGYNRQSGEVVNISGYLPYFEGIATSKKLEMPTKPQSARLFVGDLSGQDIFSIPNLPLEISQDGSILHAGKSKSKQVLKISEDVIFGLRDEAIVDVYIKLTEIGR